MITKLINRNNNGENKKCTVELPIGVDSKEIIEKLDLINNNLVTLIAGMSQISARLDAIEKPKTIEQEIVEEKVIDPVMLDTVTNIKKVMGGVETNYHNKVGIMLFQGDTLSLKDENGNIIHESVRSFKYNGGLSTIYSSDYKTRTMNFTRNRRVYQIGGNPDRELLNKMNTDGIGFALVAIEPDDILKSDRKGYMTKKVNLLHGIVTSDDETRTQCNYFQMLAIISLLDEFDITDVITRFMRFAFEITAEQHCNKLSLSLMSNITPDNVLSGDFSRSEIDWTIDGTDSIKVK